MCVENSLWRWRCCGYSFLPEFRENTRRLQPDAQARNSNVKSASNHIPNHGNNGFWLHELGNDNDANGGLKSAAAATVDFERNLACRGFC